MPKVKAVYICQSCAFESPQWLGQCPSCGEWNTFVETVVSKSPQSSSLSRIPARSEPPQLLAHIVSTPSKRVSSGVAEFDRVLGGGFVPGQVILLAGDPGIGKSTLLTQIAKSMSRSKILYVAGEENPSQIKIRADRMNYPAENLLISQGTDVDVIVGELEAQKALSLIIIDSVQTLYSEELTGMAGSVGQVRGGTQKLTNTAKKLNVPLILVGHVTKEGTVAGPKVLEHIVDTVLYLEGDAQNFFRLLRTTKNRFGPVSEIGIFEMTEYGMEEVTNPSKIFLDQKIDASGSCVTVVMEGFRPILFEIQALTVKTNFGYPKRTASGFNVNRLQVLIAILEKRCGLNLSQHDVYLNVAGGFKVGEHAVDLAVCLAIASALKDRPIPANVVAFGECGLSGEVRRVLHQERRTAEAKKLGYKSILSPDSVKSVKQAVYKVFNDKEKIS